MSLEIDADISDQMPQLYIMFWTRNSLHRPNNLCAFVLFNASSLIDGELTMAWSRSRRVSRLPVKVWADPNPKTAFWTTKSDSWRSKRSLWLLEKREAILARTTATLLTQWTSRNNEQSNTNPVARPGFHQNTTPHSSSRCFQPPRDGLRICIST